MTYFLGGTAVGMAAGLLVGKFLSKSTTKIQSFEPGAPTKESESVNKYFQDDNSHNLYFHKNIHCHTRSRSESRYENKSRTEEPIGATSLTKLNNDFKGNINYDVPKKCTNLKKISCNNNQLHNMSVENNAAYNLSAEVFPDREEEEEYNNSRISNTQNAGRKPSCLAESNNPGSTNAEHKDPSKIINTQSANSSNVKDARSCSSVVPETFNDLSSDSHVDDSSVCSNIQDANSSTTRSSILQSASYRAMCKNISQSNSEEEESISCSSSSEEFYEADLISSTRETII